MTLTPARRKLLEQAVGQYAATLTAEATAFLAGRGIPLNVAESALLGAVDDPAPGHEAYRGWLSIPYMTPTGPVGIRFRRLTDDQPKYLSPPANPIHLYNVGALHRADGTIVVCEGELDALVMDQIVGAPAVGVAGVNAWRDHFPRVLEGFDKVVLAVDNDVKPDGSNPGRELQSRLLRELPQSVAAELPPGMDVNEAVLSLGVSAVQRLVAV